MINEDWKSTIEIAERFEVTLAAVVLWRKAGCPHKVVYKGRRPICFYRVSEVQKWLDKERSLRRRKDAISAGE